MGENCSHKGNFQAMKMGLVSKCSEEHSPVRGQWSGVRGQGQNRGQISRFCFFGAFLDYMSHRDTYSRPKAAMVACGLSESHFPPKTGRMVTLKFMMFLPHFRTSDASLLCC